MSTENDEYDDALTPLDITLDRIGMGYYQWSLLGLCGFGWLADNMWMEGVAVALPRVQDHFQLSGRTTGYMSSFFFCGMMFGAIGWGNCSDVLGRRIAFNGTLIFSALFGILVSMAPNFPLLCGTLFLLGSAVGGSIPTDGTLFVENLPRRKRYLLTLLSVFFSFGAVVAAIVAVLVIPGNSCPEKPSGSSDKPPCDVSSQNYGWRYMFVVLTLLTGAMFVCRVVFFHLYESPRYLVHAGRLEDAAIVLQEISKVNGKEIDVNVEDVHDLLINAPEESALGPESYAATGTSPPRTPRTSSRSPSRSRSRSPASDAKDRKIASTRFLPRLRRAFSNWYDLTALSLAPQSRRTTILMWGIWMGTSAGYTLFNLFFPKLVELRLGKHAEGGSLTHALWNVVVYTLGGTPGSMIGAMMQETRLGKRKSLALSCAATGLLCLLFTIVPSDTAVLLTSMGISLTTTIMYAIVYGMTPHMWVTEIRGTSCGNASALNRAASIIAPPIGGLLLDMNVSFPTYASAIAFFLSAVFAYALPFESVADLEASDKRSAAYTLLH